MNAQDFVQNPLTNSISSHFLCLKQRRQSEARWLRVVSPQILRIAGFYRPSSLRRLKMPRDISGTCPDGTQRWVCEWSMARFWTLIYLPKKIKPWDYPPRWGPDPRSLWMEVWGRAPFKWATGSFVSPPFFESCNALLITGFRGPTLYSNGGGNS